MSITNCSCLAARALPDSSPTLARARRRAAASRCRRLARMAAVRSRSRLRPLRIERRAGRFAVRVWQPVKPAPGARAARSSVHSSRSAPRCLPAMGIAAEARQRAASRPAAGSSCSASLLEPPGCIASVDPATPAYSPGRSGGPAWSRGDARMHGRIALLVADPFQRGGRVDQIAGELAVPGGAPCGKKPTPRTTTSGDQSLGRQQRDGRNSDKRRFIGSSPWDVALQSRRKMTSTLVATATGLPPLQTGL